MKSLKLSDSLLIILYEFVRGETHKIDLSPIPIVKERVKLFVRHVFHVEDTGIFQFEHEQRVPAFLGL